MNGKNEGENVVGLIIAYNFKGAEEKLSGLVKQVNKLSAWERRDFIKAFSAELETAVEIGWIFHRKGSGNSQQRIR